MMTNPLPPGSPYWPMIEKLVTARNREEAEARYSARMALWRRQGRRECMYCRGNVFSTEEHGLRHVDPDIYGQPRVAGNETAHAAVE